MYLYKNNFENIGNNGAVVLGRRFFIRTCSLFQRLFVISFSRGFCYLLRQFYMFCAVWLKVMKFTGGQTDATQQMIPNIHLNLRFRSAKHSNVIVHFDLFQQSRVGQALFFYRSIFSKNNERNFHFISNHH